MSSTVSIQAFVVKWWTEFFYCFFLQNQLFHIRENASFGILQPFTFRGCRHFGGFWVLFLVDSSFHTLLELSFLPFFFSVFLSWHFLTPGMGLNRHVLLFSFCPHTSDIDYHNVLLKHSLWFYCAQDCKFTEVLNSYRYKLIRLTAWQIHKNMRGFASILCAL